MVSEFSEYLTSQQINYLTNTECSALRDSSWQKTITHGSRGTPHGGKPHVMGKSVRYQVEKPD